MDKHDSGRIDVDSFLAGFKGHFSTRGINELPDFRHVVAEYLRQHGAADGERKAHALTQKLSQLQMRIMIPSFSDVSWDKKWNNTRKQWEEKRLRLEQLLREAANIFDSGQCDAGIFPSLTKYRNQGVKMQDWILKRNGMAQMDLDYWCGSQYLRALADVIALSPVDVVFPVVHPDRGLLKPSQNIGKRGGAANPQSALPAMIVREIACYVPDTTPKRFSTIAGLATYIGINVSRNYVRSLLKKGRT